MVAPLSMTDVSELCELRFGLESMAVSFAIERASAEAIAGLRDKATPPTRNLMQPRDLIAYNLNFHVALAELSQNAHLVKAVRGILEDSQRLFYLGLSGLSIDDSIDAHLAITDALASHDVAAAKTVCEREAFGTSDRVASAVFGRRGRTATDSGI
jgi:DNA-binding GntR family transcriptional regulator